MKPCIIVRPEPGNHATAKAARALGLDVVAAPLYAINKVEFNADLSLSYDAILITSANSIRVAEAELKAMTRLPLFAVGDASAQAARTAGFKTVIAGDGDGQALGQKAYDLGYRHVLHLVGDPHKPIKIDGLICDAHIVYRAVELPPTTELLAALRRPCVVLAHSPRAARRLARLAGHHGERPATRPR